MMDGLHHDINNDGDDVDNEALEKESETEDEKIFREF